MSEPISKPRQYSPDELNHYGEYIKIGGSPVPGLTLRHILRGHTGTINRIAWSPDGKHLASPSSDMTIRIWDANTGECVAVLKQHIAKVISVAWSPDGRELVSGSADHTACIWDVETWSVKTDLGDHDYGVYSVALSPTGDKIAVGLDNNMVYIWNTQSKQVVLTVRRGSGLIKSMLWLSDGQTLVCGDDAAFVAVWNTATPALMWESDQHTTGVDCVAWSEHHQVLFSGGSDKAIRGWDIRTGRQIRVLTGNTSEVCSLSFSADGVWLASKAAGQAAAVRLWRCDTWECVRMLREVQSGEWPPALAFHPHEAVLATLGEANTVIRLWTVGDVGDQ